MQWTVIEPRRPGVRARLSEVWAYRRLIGFLGRKLVEKMTIKSKLGILWVPIRPLLTVASRALVFGGVLAAPSEGLPYFLFFLTGMAAWSLFDRTLFWSARSVEINGRYVQKLYFPHLLLPIAAFIPAILDFLVYLVLLGLTLGVYLWLDGTTYVQLGEFWLALAGVGLIFAMALGMGLYLAVLGAYTRDTRFALSYILGFWFFLTPIIYPLSAIPEPYDVLGELNPVTAPIELVRVGLYGVGEVTPIALATTATVAVVSCVSGLIFFNRWEAAAMDHL
jgi:lipopolysaccharide transport system permease protein